MARRMLNRVFLHGNLCFDSELRYVSSGAALCEFRLANNRSWKSDDGQEMEEVCFIDCTLWGRRAEALQEYLLKGKEVLVEGRLRFETWEKDGQPRSKHTVHVDELELLGGAGDRDNRGGSRRQSQDNGNQGRKGGNRGRYEDERNEHRGGRTGGRQSEGRSQSNRGGQGRGGYSQRGGEQRQSQQEYSRRDQPRAEPPPIDDEDIPF